MVDRVQLIKWESPSEGGTQEDMVPTELDPQEDAIESAGFFVQDASNRDEAVGGFRDGDDLKLFDVSNPTPTSLTDLKASGTGISEASHKILRQLIHFIDDGPAEGFATGAYREITALSLPFPTAIIWYDDATKAKKIVERLITWTGVKVTTDVWKVYNTDGSSVLATVSDAISYSGIFEQNRTRTITV